MAPGAGTRSPWGSPRRGAGCTTSCCCPGRNTAQTRIGKNIVKTDWKIFLTYLHVPIHISVSPPPIPHLRTLLENVTKFSTISLYFLTVQIHIYWSVRKFCPRQHLPLEQKESAGDVKHYTISRSFFNIKSYYQQNLPIFKINNLNIINV